MNRRIGRASLVLACGLFVAAAMPATSDASSYYGWYGYSGYWGPYGAYYRPYAYSYYSYYAPVYSYYAPSCGSACQPCGVTCNPCSIGACDPCSIGSCPGGVCGVNYGEADDKWRATDPDRPRTYEEDPGPLGPPADDTRPGDPGFGDRDTNPLDGAPFPNDTETRKPESATPPSIIDDKNSAPATSPLDLLNDDRPTSGAGGPNARLSSERKRTSDQPTDRLPRALPTARLDHRITSTSQPTHRRLVLRATFRSPVVARRSVSPTEPPRELPVDVRVVQRH